MSPTGAADAEGGLKTGRTSARFYSFLGGAERRPSRRRDSVSHQQARAGIYRAIAYRC